MAIMITGSRGYIGSHLREALKAYDIYEVDEKIEVDLGSINALDFDGIDTVIHCAGDISVRESMHDPLKYYYNNVVETVAFLDSIKDTNVKRIIFSSTAAVYDTAQPTPFTENTLLNPTSVYGRTKMMCEHIIKDFCAKYNKCYTIFRYFNVAGAASSLLGENHEPEEHLIPNIVSSFIKKEPVNLYGTDYPTIDGTCVRDFIHITDLVNAHISAIEDMGNRSEIINLGNGIGHTVKEVINRTMKLLGPIDVIIQPRRDGDCPILVCDNSKAKSLLSWNPKKTLSDMIVSDYVYRCHR